MAGRIKAKSKAKKSTWDPQKDNIFRQLASILTASGVQVRREELKQGHGWKVMSGSCRLNELQLIFVDRKLPQDEQIAFLASRIAAANVVISDEQRAMLPEHVVGMIESTKAMAA